jgi:hypothetical protein
LFSYGSITPQEQSLGGNTHSIKQDTVWDNDDGKGLEHIVVLCRFCFALQIGFIKEKFMQLVDDTLSFFVFNGPASEVGGRIPLFASLFACPKRVEMILPPLLRLPADLEPPGIALSTMSRTLGGSAAELFSSTSEDDESSTSWCLRRWPHSEQRSFFVLLSSY